MARFARLVGEWQVTFASGATGVHAWQWGPGMYSMRQMAHASSVDDNPWTGEVIYWHPGRKEVRLLSMHGDIPAVGRGVTEGSIKFEGDTEVGTLDLYQPRGLRKLGTRRTFEGRDKYHDDLLEDTGSGLQPMNGWDFYRITERTEAGPRVSDEAPPALAEHLRFFELLLGHTWEATGEVQRSSTPGSPVRIQSTFDWVPSLQVICARVTAIDRDGKATHVLDAYVYHHLGMKVVRCLALSNRGGVYEGDVTVIDGDALQIELMGYEGDELIPLTVGLDVDADGTLRKRIWSRDHAHPSLVIDARHRKAATDSPGE